MKLAIWFAIKNPDGSKRRKYELAHALGKAASSVTAYCDGRATPPDETIELIAIFTEGEVTRADFYPAQEAA